MRRSGRLSKVGYKVHSVEQWGLLKGVVQMVNFQQLVTQLEYLMQFWKALDLAFTELYLVFKLSTRQSNS